MKKPEVWMRGPIADVPALLQPVAHALLQASEDMQVAMNEFDASHLWAKPAGMASVGFHLRHLSGVLDRLFTYARAESLTPQQFTYLQDEGIEDNDTPAVLLDRFRAQVDSAVVQLKATSEHDLLSPRGIGRQQIPTTVLGLLFHAAEHSQRHVGQLLVTVRWVMAETTNLPAGRKGAD